MFFFGFSQNNKKRYKEKLEPNSKLISAGYNFTVEKTKTDKFIFKKYFPETKQITHYMTFKSSKLEVWDGEYMEWYDNGDLILKGNFVNDKKNGKWKEFSSEGKYEKGKKNGKWIRVNNDGQIIEEQNYLGGELDGMNITFDSTGQVIMEEEYKMGELISTTTDTTKKVIEVMPRFFGCEEIKGSIEEKKKCADKKLLKYVYGKIKYPKIARKNNIEGNVMIQFVIDEDGNVTDIRPLRALCAAIRDECVELVENMPKWTPGLQNGKPVRVQFNLPIKFNLK